MAVFPTRAVACLTAARPTASPCSRPRTCPMSSSTRSTRRCSASSPTSKLSSLQPAVSVWHTNAKCQSTFETEIRIDRLRSEVAAYASDPDNATSWYENIKAVEWKSQKPGRRRLQDRLRRPVPRAPPGIHLRGQRDRSRRTVRHGHRSRTFPMETSYSWADIPSGGTEMTLRNRGQPVGFSKLAAPMIAAAMRRANQRDLQRLKAILETTGDS